MISDHDLGGDLELLLARQILYRFAATALSDPRLGTFPLLSDPCSAVLVRDAALAVRSEPRCETKSLGQGEVSLEQLKPEAVLAELPATPEKFNTLYEDTFGLLVSSSCPPYATEYIDRKLNFQRSNALADIAGFYRAFGLDPSPDYPERQDYLVLQLEFLASLTGLERHALAEEGVGGTERAEVCRAAGRRFLTEHLVGWTPTFARLLELKAATGFYAKLATFLAAWMTAERAFHEIPLASEAALPSRIEPPEECEGCVLVDEAL